MWRRSILHVFCDTNCKPVKHITSYIFAVPSSQLDQMLQAHGTAMRPLNAPYRTAEGATGPPNLDDAMLRELQLSTIYIWSCPSV